MNPEAYLRAQRALAELKAAVYQVLTDAPAEGLSNAEIGRSLGIYAGHKGHEGHVSRTLLGLMEKDGVVEQVDDKRWQLRRFGEGGGDAEG